MHVSLQPNNGFVYETIQCRITRFIKCYKRRLTLNFFVQSWSLTLFHSDSFTLETYKTWEKKMINRTTSFSWPYTWDRRVQTIGPKSRRNRDLRPLQTSSLLVPMLWMKWICNTAIKVYEYHNFFLNQYLLPLKFIHDKLGLIFCNFIGKNHWSLCKYIF